MQNVVEVSQEIKNRHSELLEVSSKELKSYYKERDLEAPKGYWKMTKDQMIEEIIVSEQSLIVAKANLSKNIKDAQVEEVKPKEEVASDVPEEPKRKPKSSKFMYKAFDPKGNLKFESPQLKEVVDYSMTNGIASRGWVNLSIEREIPVLIGLGYNAEITPDFVPRTTSKYSGNYWKFVKEPIENQE